MSNYQLDITNYKAIHQASVKLNGITVLAGLNGSRLKDATDSRAMPNFRELL